MKLIEGKGSDAMLPGRGFPAVRKNPLLPSYRRDGETPRFSETSEVLYRTTRRYQRRQSFRSLGKGVWVGLGWLRMGSGGSRS